MFGGGITVRAISSFPWKQQARLGDLQWDKLDLAERSWLPAVGFGLRALLEVRSLEVRRHFEERGPLIRKEVEHLVIRHGPQRRWRHHGLALGMDEPASIYALIDDLADGASEHSGGIYIHP